MSPDIKACRNNDLPDACMFNATEECLDTFFELYNRMECMNDCKDFISRNSTVMEACGCNPPCNEVSYDVSYSLSKWPATGYEGDSAFFDVFYLENFWERFNGTPKYQAMREYFSEANRNESMNDFARLNAYIADSNVIITQEREDYTSTQLVSDIGGQLGLWVGISIITLAEVLELMCDMCRFFLKAQRPTPSRHYVDKRNNHDNNHMDIEHTNKPRESMYVSAFDPRNNHTDVDNDREASSPFMRMPYTETIFR